MDQVWSRLGDTQSKRSIDQIHPKYPDSRKIFFLMNIPIISIKTGSKIEINELDNYDEAYLTTYQQLIDKLIFLTYITRWDNAFVIERPSKHNINA